MAVRVGVDQMGNEVEALAIDVLFTGMVEMELFEGVDFIAHGEGAAGERNRP